jgi:hypothetical protein
VSCVIVLIFSYLLIFRISRVMGNRTYFLTGYAVTSLISLFIIIFSSNIISLNLSEPKISIFFFLKLFI